MRKNIAAGNWKMNCDFNEAIDLAEGIAEGKRNEKSLTILAVPSLYLNKVQAVVGAEDDVFVAAQNCHHMESGAYTGEISAKMLSSIGIRYVLIGHSERREYFNEGSAILEAKLRLALDHRLLPIYCCGEPLDVRKSGNHVAYVVKQLEETLFKLSADDMSNIIVAYEPIWAIGTGETASSEQAQEMHQALRASIADRFGNDVAEGMSILYGGSVKAANAKDIFSKKDVDGGLVGGASLKVDEFLNIINSFE